MKNVVLLWLKPLSKYSVAMYASVQFSSVTQSFLTLATPWIAACQASLSITNSRSSLRLMSIELVMSSSHLILCRPLLLLPPITPSIFLGSKITAHGDCSHDIKRCLLLERKVMTNLDSIFKSIDITLPTKVHLVKAMVFPEVMYGCESWTIKKAEWQRTDASPTVVLEKTREFLVLRGDQTSQS